jgi:hypothetical protein
MKSVIALLAAHISQGKLIDANKLPLSTKGSKIVDKDGE